MIQKPEPCQRQLVQHKEQIEDLEIFGSVKSMIRLIRQDQNISAGDLFNGMQGKMFRTAAENKNNFVEFLLVQPEICLIMKEAAQHKILLSLKGIFGQHAINIVHKLLIPIYCSFY